MRLEIYTKITVNASAEKAWRVIAHDYGNIGQWAAMITKSHVIIDEIAPGGAKVAGRICSAQGFGDVQERFTYYDDQSMRFGYEAMSGLPWFIKRANNNWSVYSLRSELSVIEMRGETDFNFFVGMFLVPVFKLLMSRKGDQLGEELKYYIEHDQPHPRKLQQLQKTAVRS